MNIKSAQYKTGIHDDDNLVIICTTDDDEVMYVPVDPSNRHYAAILEWAKEDSNTIKEAD